MTSDTQLPIVILAGGSEIVALAIAEVFVPYNIPLVVIGLGKPSLIRDVQPGMVYRQIAWPPRSVETALSELTAVLIEIGAGQPQPWPTFATEDGGLRLLLEKRQQLQQYLAIAPGSRHLIMGGLDKAELFSFLQAAGLGNLIAPTVNVNDMTTAQTALEELGGEAIFKPALKPLSMDMGALGAKAFAIRKGDSSAWQKQLEQGWAISLQWVAQPFLHTPSEGEALWWGMRTQGGAIAGVTAYERWKQPRIGGSACWVEVTPVPPLHIMADQILGALDFHGVTELPFLQDAEGNWRLLEANLRPWLQVGILPSIGFALLPMLYNDLIGKDDPVADPLISDRKRWVNVERMLLAAWSGDYGTRWKTIWHASQIIINSDYKAVYSTPFAKVRGRWLARMAGKAIAR